MRIKGLVVGVAAMALLAGTASGALAFDQRTTNAPSHNAFGSPSAARLGTGGGAIVPDTAGGTIGPGGVVIYKHGEPPAVSTSRAKTNPGAMSIPGR
ncbi:MAG TPA: hypothetical protein VJ770_26600 [Stellaceae bacterium]|nr:hypothetical protein [Stellaceae bacterium]